MDRHASSAELKAKAKGQMLGKYGTLVPAFLVVEAIMVTISFLATFSLDTRSMTGLTIQFVIECLLQLLAGIFIAGQTYMYLNVSCGGNIKISDVFYGFTNHPDKAILIQLLQLLLCLVFFIPLFICLGIFAFIDGSLSVMLLLLSITFCIGLVGSTIISLQYSQSYFVMLDFPDFTAIQCLRYSREIMKGNKARRFYLGVSFIPLYLLGLLTCCIGLLFVTPYANTTFSNFYLELMSYRNSHNL